MQTRTKAIAIALLLVVAVGLVAAEIAARVAFGFSMNEPIVIFDKSCEYRLAPGDYAGGYRVNSRGMRSEELPEEKPAGEFRVLVLGDSITEGDTSLPNESLATYNAERILNEGDDPDTSCRFLNVSVGSWSVMNQMGFIDAFGDFDADAIVLVWNSGDAIDGFGTPLAPTSQPICGIHRALRLLRVRIKSRSGVPILHEPGGIFARANADALDRLADHAESRGIPLLAIWHPTQAETESGYDESRAQTLLDVFDARGVPVTRFADTLRDVIQAGGAPYADHIHLSNDGHVLLAQTIAGLIEAERATEGAAPETPSNNAADTDG